MGQVKSKRTSYQTSVEGRVNWSSKHLHQVQCSIQSFCQLDWAVQKVVPENTAMDDSYVDTLPFAAVPNL